MTLSMEQINSEFLPPIFKLSALCNILPYFGYLHEWKNLLESISTGANQVWNENREALMHWGKDYKQETWIIYDHDEFIINKSLPQNLELFTLTTNWFDWVDHKKEKNNWINIRLITILLNRLNIKNAIIIEQHRDNCLKSITIWTEYEAEESTPSSMCTSVTSNITEFDEDKVADLWKHIYEKVQSRRVVLKKKENNIIDVNSVVPHFILESEDYNLLSSDYEKVKDNLYCPVDNWICKPASLWWYPFKITKEINQLKFESLTEETSEEIIRKIWDLSITKIIKQLKVSNMIKDFSSFENLLKLKEVNPNIVIVFDFKYEETKSQNPSWRFIMNSKAVTCVLKGREWNFEQIRNWDVKYDLWSFFDIKQIENSSYAFLKMNWFEWRNLVIKERSWVDDWIKSCIDELKKNTETNDDLFIIADLNNLAIYLHFSDINKYSSILKYFKHIIISIWLFELWNKTIIEEINNLPKQHQFDLRWYYYKDTKYDFLNLIDPRFENLSIRYSGYPYEIKIKRPKSKSNEPISKWSIVTINRMNRQMIKTDSEYLRKLLFTM